MIVISIVHQTLAFSLPILIAGLGGLFSERSGVANIALEGLMMIGACAAATVIVFLEKVLLIAPWISIAVGAIVGAVFSVTHAYISIHMKGDQIISATALNFFALGGTIFFADVIFGQQRTATFQQGFSKITVPVLSKIPIIGDIFFTNVYSPLYLGVLLVVIAWFVLNKTIFGLRLRATGEHPHAVDSAGINVYTMRYAGVIISGFLAGLAGGIMVLTQDTQYSVTSIHGTGFIALAALIFGKWTVFGLLRSTLFFGFFQILVIYSTDIPFLMHLPLEFFKAIPYLLTVVVLIAFGRKSFMPKSLGIPYYKDER